jgi:hypothetical protein
MNNNKNKSIVMIVAVLSLSIFVLSSALGKPVSAQPASNSKADDGINSYKDFKNCLLNAESTKGYATKKEIKACFSPIYINATSSGSTDTSAPSAGQ